MIQTILMLMLVAQAVVPKPPAPKIPDADQIRMQVLTNQQKDLQFQVGTLTTQYRDLQDKFNKVNSDMKDEQIKVLNDLKLDSAKFSIQLNKDGVYELVATPEKSTSKP